MHAMTAANLRSAHGGESMAFQRYTVWGARAAEEGFPNVARLFEAIAFAEQVHAGNHFRELADENGDSLVASMVGFGLGKTVENLGGAIDGELFEVTEMYPAYVETANLQAESGAKRSFLYALEAEKIHAAMFTQAKQAVETDHDIELGPIQVCGRCGYTHEGETPDRCPVCGVSGERFKTFE